MNGYLITSDGQEAPADSETVQRLLREDRLLWLDLYRPERADLAMLVTLLGDPSATPSGTWSRSAGKIPRFPSSSP